MTTDADKIRFLAELAEGCMAGDKPDYPHSLDAIARDLLPILREKGWGHELAWDYGEDYSFFVWTEKEVSVCRTNPSPARAAFEAIWQALHGGEE